MNHSDPTANQAIGAVGREWNHMVQLAIRLRTHPQQADPRAEAAFTGIYRRLLTEPLDELLREAPASRKKR